MNFLKVNKAIYAFSLEGSMNDKVENLFQILINQQQNTRVQIKGNELDLMILVHIFPCPLLLLKYAYIW